MDLLLRLALIGTACFLGVVIIVLIFRYRKVSSKKDVQLGREEVLGRLFLRKLRSLGEGEEEPAALLKKLSGLMRTFFSELFDISYEFDYVELNEELSKKGVDGGVRQDIIDYSMKAEEFQYGGRALTEQDISAIVEKSVMIIKAVTERKPEKEEQRREKKAARAAAGEKEPAPLVEKKPGRFAGLIDAALRKPAQKREKTPMPDEEMLQRAEESVPQAPVPPAKEKPQKVTPEEAKAEQKLRVPPAKEGKVQRIRKLLVSAESDLSAGNSDGSMESYAQLREIYESLPQDEKRELAQETHRIISLYNSLLGEYKDALSSGSSRKPKA
jgi:hypothetical protein